MLKASALQKGEGSGPCPGPGDLGKNMFSCPLSMLFESLGRDQGVLNAEFAGVGHEAHG